MLLKVLSALDELESCKGAGRETGVQCVDHRVEHFLINRMRGLVFSSEPRSGRIDPGWLHE